MTMYQRFLHIIAFATLAIMAFITLFSNAFAQQSHAQSGQVLKVGTRIVQPFVTEQDGKLQGFSIELWQALSDVMGKRSVLLKSETLQNLLDSVEARDVDVAIAAISITSAREEKFDFSQPMFDSGLQIMVRADGNASGFSLQAMQNLLTTGPMPGLLMLLGLLILIPAHVVWLAERRHPNSLVGQHYFPGIFHSIWWATGAAHGQQLDHPKSPVGKAVSALSIFVSVIFIAIFTASVTTALTVQQLKGDINGPEDLPGKRVSTVSGSTSAAYLRQNGIPTVESPTIAVAIRALLEKQTDAVLFDSPVLLYFAAQEGKGKVNVVGGIFRKEAYGILFSQNSTLRKPVNEALLKLKENGTYDALYKKWFQREDKG
jgi:polar amino acid transport system substrate-binding protein